MGKTRNLRTDHCQLTTVPEEQRACQPILTQWVLTGIDDDSLICSSVLFPPHVTETITTKGMKKGKRCCFSQVVPPNK